MKTILILGAGTAGTMMAQHLLRSLGGKGWKIQIVDARQEHYYQPGFLFLPFGINQEKEIVRPIGALLPAGVEWINAQAERIDIDANKIILENGRTLVYDFLIIATGSNIAPEEVPGLLEGDGWQRNILDFYTIEGARRLREGLADFQGGNLVVHIAEMPIKCPVAPLEFAFLADWYLEKKGLRSKTRITYLTPLSGAFTRPVASEYLGHLLDQKNVHVEADFVVERVDSDAKTIQSYDGRSIEYDLLVTVPPNMGDAVISRSGLGDELNFVPVHKHTLQARARSNIFVLGDATDIPASKAGSVAHFQSELLTLNIQRAISGKELEESFDGHANCFVETGYGKGLLIDFNYDYEPVPGKFPLAVVGPLALLKENRINHWSKLAFRWIYWNVLLKGRSVPFIPSRMSLAGKRLAVK
ncbi:MAG: NAD(P)/FAD-dependent oxidoreductase [Spirochaetales bacterium]|nr:NAD(P)/FAD-dependent oxidoreductase [Spirochaetales bacterium]